MQKTTQPMEHTTDLIHKQRLCFVAGRSGGHIIPCLTLAKQHRLQNPSYEIMFFSTHAQLDQHLLHNDSTITHHIPLTLENVPLKKFWKLPRFFWNLSVAILQSFRRLYALKPERIITTGGYIAIPVCFAAKLLRIPIELYEVNVVPGKAISFLAPIAHTIWICFEQTKNYLPAHKCKQTTYPIKFTPDDPLITKQEALKKLQFHPKKKTILVLGGSQGSLFINNAIKELLKNHPSLQHTVQIIHQTGAQDRTDWQQIYASMGIPSIVFSYQTDMATYYAATDLVLCRSGAGSLAEVIFFKKKCITIPLETAATMHQVDNAHAMGHMHPDLITVIRQDQIKGDRTVLFKAITGLLLLY